MPDIGNAYVQILPSAQGITKKVEGVLSGPLQQAGRGLGPSLSQSMMGGLKSVGNAMTSFITKPALGAVAALGGMTLFSGWKRMTEIDNAKGKLQAIGNSAKDMEKITTQP